jgi:predicted CxxxxCH...CXXCH cytochrome family protein
VLVCAIAALLSISACGDGATRTRPTAQVAMSRAAATAPVACGTLAHPKHAEVKITCQACHPCGGVIDFTMTATYTRGTAMTGTWNAAVSPPTCTVACHSPMGAPTHTLSWTTSGPLACVACHVVPANHSGFTLPPSPTRADCTTCHDMSQHTSGQILAGHAADWSDPTKPGFHAYSANQGLGACTPCHGATLAGGIARGCGACHDSMPGHPLPPGVTTWKKDCTMCHGGTANLTGAPPKATWGHQDDFMRIGAHSAHVAPSPISSGFACNVCHVTPADALSPGHIDNPIATVTFGGIASQGLLRPTWDAGTATCSTTYCHGASLVGGTNRTPNWTKVDGTQAACGTCHGIPPAGVYGHNFPLYGHDKCTWCHYDVANADGTAITNPAAHINGVVDVIDPNWNPPPDCAYCHAY